jgi:hypothetical protein
MATISLTDNYTDPSSNSGFQFKFMCVCMKCGNGFMSTFQPNALGNAAAAAQAAYGLLGGLFGRAAQSAEALQQMVAGPQHDAALKKAVEEIGPIFKR